MRVRLRRRWSARTVRFAVLALACGAIASLLVARQEHELVYLRSATGEPVPVVRAARALTRGTVLASGDLEITAIPIAFAPPGAVATVDAVVGRTLLTDLDVGEAVTATRLGTRAGPIAAQVPAGFRAFTIPVAVPDGALRPGDRVDVLGAFGGPRPWSDVVATALEVLAILEPAPGDPSGRTSLVLLVSGTTAERLAYASAFADLTVAIAGG
jgi:Flp pilus assembly protein CpaB